VLHCHVSGEISPVHHLGAVRAAHHVSCKTKGDTSFKLFKQYRYRLSTDLIKHIHLGKVTELHVIDRLFFKGKKINNSIKSVNIFQQECCFFIKQGYTYLLDNSRGKGR
jgi:hypothetical protein